MKTFRADFSLEFLGVSEINEVMSYRHHQYAESQEYKTNINDMENMLTKIPDKETQLKLSNVIFDIDCSSFKAGYQAVLSDLMVTLTFNKSQLTSTDKVILE